MLATVWKQTLLGDKKPILLALQSITSASGVQKLPQHCVRGSAVTRPSTAVTLTCDVNAVAWLHFVHQVIVRVHDGCVRRLTRRHVFWGLLDLHLRSIHEQMPQHHSLPRRRIQILRVIRSAAICSVRGRPPPHPGTSTPPSFSPSVCLRTPSGCGWAPGCGCCYSCGTQPAPRYARGPPPRGCWRRTPGTGRTPPASQGSAARIGSPCRWWWSADQCL